MRWYGATANNAKTSSIADDITDSKTLVAICIDEWLTPDELVVPQKKVGMCADRYRCFSIGLPVRKDVAIMRKREMPGESTWMLAASRMPAAPWPHV